MLYVKHKATERGRNPNDDATPKAVSGSVDRTKAAVIATLGKIWTTG